MLELKELSFQVETEGQGKEIIRNVSLTIPERKLIVITGPNGGGKSTLAKLIAGIEKPTGGRIFFGGEDITEKNADWKITGFDWDTEKHMRAVDMVKEGKIRIEDHQDDNGIVIRPVTESDLGE